MRHLTIVCAAVLICFPACIIDFDEFGGFNSSDYRYKFEDRYDRDLEGSIDQVALTIVNGSITVEAWDIDRIEIAVHERIKANDETEAEELADAVKLVGDMKGTTLDIALDYGDFYNRRKYYACNLEIKVPKRLKLRLHTTNGGMEIEEMAGSIFASTTNGSLKLAGCGGDVELDTTNGSIVARHVTGAVKADSTNGNIEVESISGPVQAGTTNGEIEATIERALEGDVSLSSTNGGIRLSINPASGFRIEADTSNGGISDDLPDSDFTYNRRRTNMTGTYGNGAFTIRLDTTNGGISIRRN